MPSRAGAALAGIDLSDTRLDGVRLENANLSGAKLVRARIQGANLQWANLADAEGASAEGPFTDLSLPDRWILSRVNRLITDVTELFDLYQYGEAGRRINDFLWNDAAILHAEQSEKRRKRPG